MHIRLVVNPRASSTTDRHRAAVVAELARDHLVDVVETERRDHATELAAAAVRDGVDAVAVLGGDGTLNEVADALVGTDCVLVALPGGGTNVFCRTIGLPDDPAAAARECLEGLEQLGARRVGVGSVSRPGAHGSAPRHFCFHAGLGWDAEVVAVVERHAGLKRRLGHALFVYAGARTFFAGFDRRRPHFRVDVDEGTTVPDAYFAIVMNSDPYTYVGHRPFVIDPANRADAPFTVAVLRSMRVRHFLAVMAAALRGRGLRERPQLVVRSGVRGVTVHRTTSLAYQVDGEHLGNADELRISYRPDALTIAVPAHPR